MNIDELTPEMQRKYRHWFKHFHGIVHAAIDDKVADAQDHWFCLLDDQGDALTTVVTMVDLTATLCRVANPQLLAASITDPKSPAVGINLDELDEWDRLTGQMLAASINGDPSTELAVASTACETRESATNMMTAATSAMRASYRRARESGNYPEKIADRTAAWVSVEGLSDEGRRRENDDLSRLNELGLLA